MEDVNFMDVLLGNYTWHTYVAGLFWSLIGSLFVKSLYLDKNKAMNTTFLKAVKFWLNDNSRNIFNVLITSLVILRFGDNAVGVFEHITKTTLPKMGDFIVVLMVISGLIQWWRHKHRKPISTTVLNEMKEHNDNR